MAANRVEKKVTETIGRLILYYIRCMYIFLCAMFRYKMKLRSIKCTGIGSIM